MTKVPQRGDRVQERNTAGIIHHGIIEKFVEVDGEDYVEIQFTDELYPDQIPLGYFTRSDDMNGYWNKFLNCWCLDPTEEQMEYSKDPEVKAFSEQLNQSAVLLNNKLLKERLNAYVDCTILQLESLAIQAEIEMERVGKRHPYYQFWVSQSLDYKRLLDLKIRGDVTWQTSTVALSKRYGLDALRSQC